MRAHGPILGHDAPRRLGPTGELADPLAWLAELLELGGLDAGLAFLNSRVEHMCSAIYRLADGMLYMDHYYDAAGGAPLAILRAIPLGDSFCQYAMRDGQFSTRESLRDERLRGHPYRALVASYEGFPLIDEAGGYLGTLCHFDIVERNLSESQRDFQAQAARLLPAYL